MATLVVGVGIFRSRSEATGTDPCAHEAAGCEATVPTPGTGSDAPRVDAATFCVDVGYLCSELVDEPSIRLRRWKDETGTIVVHVPLPDFEDSGIARDLQRAAAQGLRAWNNQPFPVLIDLRGDRNPHFSVRWTRSLGGTQLGVARTQWSVQTGLSVTTIELVTRSPFDPARLTDPRAVRLTAAHEMGHALGLPHSDSQRDVMYPTNTATSMSAQDYRSVEVLYQTPDGTIVGR